MVLVSKDKFFSLFVTLGKSIPRARIHMALLIILLQDVFTTLIQDFGTVMSYGSRFKRIWRILPKRLINKKLVCDIKFSPKRDNLRSPKNSCLITRKEFSSSLKTSIPLSPLVSYLHVTVEGRNRFLVRVA